MSEMVLDRNYHIFKVTRRVATGHQVIGYYYADDKKRIEEYLNKWDVAFDKIEVVPIVNVVEADEVCRKIHPRHHQSISDTEIGKLFRKIIGGGSDE